jgi:hypothetical protein
MAIQYLDEEIEKSNIQYLDDEPKESNIRYLDDKKEDPQPLAEISQEPEGLVENAKFIADDVGNQFNNTIANLAGAPVDLIGFTLNKASNAIFDQDISPSDRLGGSESIRKGMEFITGARVRDEPAKTKAGVVAQVAGEAVGFTVPALKVAQVASKVQATSKAGQVGVNLAKQFTDEATKNTGRFLAIESGAVAGQSGGRILSQEKDLSPGATLAVELLTGITGALAGDKTFGVSKTLINKARGKTAQEIMESVARGDITYKDLEFKPVIDGQKKYGFEPTNLRELEFTPVTPKKTVIEETIGEMQPLEVTVGGKKIPSEAPSTSKLETNLNPKKVKSAEETGGFPIQSVVVNGETRYIGSYTEPGLGRRYYFTDKKGFGEFDIDGKDVYKLLKTEKILTTFDTRKELLDALKNKIDEAPATPKDTPEATPAPVVKDVPSLISYAKDKGMRLVQLKSGEGGAPASVSPNEKGDITLMFDVDKMETMSPEKVNALIQEEVIHAEHLLEIKGRWDGKGDFRDFANKDAASELESMAPSDVLRYLREYGNVTNSKVTEDNVMEIVSKFPLEERARIVAETRQLKSSEATPSLLTPPKETPSMPGITRQNFDEARGEIASNLLATQRTQLAVDAGNLNNYAPGSNKRPNRLFNRINSWLAPSKVVGREVMNEIDQAKGIIREAESVGIRAYNAVNRIKKSNPNDTAAIDENVNAFFLTGELDPSLAPIQTELSAWRSSTNKLRERLIGGMDDQAFMDLAPEVRESLRTVLKESMDTSGGYLTQPYRLFEDPDYKPTKQQEDAAFKEIRSNLVGSGMSVEKAGIAARKRINELKGNSAKTKELESKSGLRPSESENILRQRVNPGQAERIWLGEITDPAQRALITSRRLSRLASAKAEDAEIANLLLNSGVASRTAREGQVELKLKTVSGKTNIYVDPEVADSIYKLRYGPTINQGIRNPVDAAINAFFTANFVAKFTKVVGNVGSYPVAALGSITSAMANGVMPNFSGMRSAAASFRSLENFVAGKSPDAKKKFYADLDKMDLYNLRPKSIDAADMEATLQRGFKILNKKILGKAVDIGGKAYSAFDVAMRYVTWKGTQTQLKQAFPDYTPQQIEAAAARITNDTFPNYDKLSEVVRQGSRVGFFQPFIAHFAELSRVSYNQGKFALQMMKGNFGKDFGLDPSRADMTEMRKMGAKRLAALGLVTAGAKVAVNSKNEESGLNERSVQAFEESVLPSWMDGTVAIINPNKDNPRRGVFVPPEYILPQIAMGDAFAAGFQEKPFEEYASILKGRIFSEGGSLALQTIGKITSGYDERGNPIYIDPSLSAKTEVIASTIYDDVIKPGTFRTFERFNDSINGIGDRTTAQNVQSLFGWRVYTYDADRSFTGKFSQASSMMNTAKGTYTSAFNKRIKGDISQQELDATYNKMNTARSNRLDQARVHYTNMGAEPLNYSLDESIAIMKEGGLSSLDILDVIGGTYTDMPKNITDKTRDRYDEIPGNLNAKGKAILSLPQSDPYRKKLGLYHKKQLKAESQNIDAVDSLIISLTPDQTADYLIRIGADKNSKILNTYLRKDPARLEIIKILDVRSSN